MAEEKRKRSKIIPIILIAVVLSGLGYGINEFVFSLHHQTTDDAQVDGDITPINARISGYVEEIRFIENQHVKKGDTLVKIDDRDLHIKVEVAQAALANAVAGVGVVKANISTAEANVSTALASVEQQKVNVWKTSQDFTRYQGLIDSKSVTQSQYDAVKAAKESAEAALAAAEKQLAAAKAQVSAADQQVSVAEAQVKQRQADLDFAQLQLSYANILSPVDGIVSKKNIETGQLVQPGQALFAIVTDTNTYIVANFKETQLGKMTVGQKVDVSIDAFPNQTIEGSVFSFSGATGARFSLLPPDNASGNFVKVVQRVPVRIAMKLPKDMTNKLRPGMSARVIVDTD